MKTQDEPTVGHLGSAINVQDPSTGRTRPLYSLPSYIQGLPKAGALHLVYIYKEVMSRTVVREVLPRATTHRRQTLPDYGRHTRSQSKGGDVREEAPAEECAAKNLQTTVRHIGFTEKIYGFPRTFLCCQYKEELQPLFANSSRERRRNVLKRSQPWHAVPHINIR